MTTAVAIPPEARVPLTWESAITMSCACPYCRSVLRSTEDGVYEHCAHYYHLNESHGGFVAVFRR